MQLASLISDLTTLQACDNAAALALVTAAKSHSQGSTNQLSSNGADIAAKAEQEEKDVDMRRATSLLQLHQDAKVAFSPPSPASGGNAWTDPAKANADLEEARHNVDQALRGLGINPGVQKGPIQTVLSSNVPTKNAQDADDDDDADLEAWS